MIARVAVFGVAGVNPSQALKLSMDQKTAVAAAAAAEVEAPECR